MLKTCSCGKQFETRRSTAKSCSDKCRKRVQRMPEGAEAKFTVLPTAAEPADDGGSEGDLTAIARSELRAADRESTSAGQLVLALARRIDRSSQETGAGLAALVKEFRASLTAAVAGAEQADDPVDEVRAFAERKRRSR